MADLDDFDTLSNAELRAKMIAQGLPNIPVTDSSRKVLVKRLRASIGGQASPAAASPKKSNRRETLAPSAAPAAASTPVDKQDGNKVALATKARRTIAAAEAKEAERRRPEEPVARKPTTTTAPAPAAGIQLRRTSTSSTVSEKKEAERPAKKPEPIAEEPAALKRTNLHENTLEVNSLIVLESDEEEDEQLVQAADLVEQQYAAREKVLKATSKGVTTTYDYSRKATSGVTDPPRRQVYEAPTVDPPRRQAYEPAAASTISAARTQTSSYDYLSNRPGRYSSYVRSPAQSYVTAEAPVLPSTSSYPRTYANELSDDNEADDAQYESTFTRNLARLRAERIGDRSSPFSRRTVATGSVGYEPRARRSLRPDDNSVSVAFSRWLDSLEQKYHFKSKLFIVLVVLLLIGVYSIFF